MNDLQDVIPSEHKDVSVPTGYRMRGVYRILVGKPGERDHWVDPGVDGRIILRWIFRKWDVGV